MKKAYVIRIKTTGEIETVEIDSDNLLSELQRLVGGYIQICPMNPNGMLSKAQALVVNEEGKLNSMAYNAAATQIYGNPNDHIVGDAIIVKVIPDDIAPFRQLEYVKRNIIEPLKYKLFAALEYHDGQ